jgi:hypothetical protein
LGAQQPSEFIFDEVLPVSQRLNDPLDTREPVGAGMSVGLGPFCMRSDHLSLIKSGRRSHLMPSSRMLKNVLLITIATVAVSSGQSLSCSDNRGVPVTLVPNSLIRDIGQAT